MAHLIKLNDDRTKASVLEHGVLTEWQVTVATNTKLVLHRTPISRTYVVRERTGPNELRGTLVNETGSLD